MPQLSQKAGKKKKNKNKGKEAADQSQIIDQGLTTSSSLNSP